MKEVTEAAQEKEKLKQAAIEFRRAGEFVPGYKDSSSRYEKARKGAVIRMAVLPFVDTTYQNLGNAVTDQVLAKAVNSKPEFIEFVTRENLNQLETEKEIGREGLIDPKTVIKRGRVLGAEYLVSGKILSATVDYPKRTDTKGSNTCRFHERKDQYINGEVFWKAHELRTIARLNSSFQVIEVLSGRIMNSNSVKIEESDLARWVEFSGDEECLPRDVNNFSNGKKNLESGTVLMDRAIEKASAEMAGRILEGF